ncbi:Globin-like protein 26 [Trichinella murrelli]|uniref:Globin-like protein 26 n=1 Tax=Trichinella murrelli TaxID=144512 RepID=A0A0V0TII2_9BILA|nr:Globin-like protein 26 [Trichinella murrelli]
MGQRSSRSENGCESNMSMSIGCRFSPMRRRLENGSKRFRRRFASMVTPRVRDAFVAGDEDMTPQELQLTSHQRSLLFKSWRDDFTSLYELGTDIYSEIFRNEPDARKLFPVLANWSGDIRDCPQFSSQALKFVQVISLALRYLDWPAKLNDILQRIGRQHAKYAKRGFRIDHWNTFQDAIVLCMRHQMTKVDDFDSADKEEAATVWRMLAVYIIQHMRAGFLKQVKDEKLKL